MPKTTFFNLDKIKQERILNAAKKEFTSKGYEKTTVVNICDNAEIKRVSFYSYFDSLDDIHDFIFKGENNKCGAIFNNQNILDGIRKDKMNIDDFQMFEKYYLSIISSSHGLRNLYITINEKPLYERKLLNLLVSLFMQYELKVISREKVIDEFNSMIE